MGLFLCWNGALKSLLLLVRGTSPSVLSDAPTTTYLPAPFSSSFPPFMTSQPPSQTKPTNCNNGETLPYLRHPAPSCSSPCFFFLPETGGFSCSACMCASIGFPSMLLCVGHTLPQLRLSERCAGPLGVRLSDVASERLSGTWTQSMRRTLDGKVPWCSGGL